MRDLAELHQDLPCEVGEDRLEQALTARARRGCATLDLRSVVARPLRLSFHSSHLPYFAGEINGMNLEIEASNALLAE
jgi:hypothetical protein